MINVLLPAMGNSTFFKDYYFPKLMLEIKGETILEKVVSNFKSLPEKKFIFVFNQSECNEFHTDESARIITQPDSVIIHLKNQTKGALCTCLMAIDYVCNDDPLIIANVDQIIDVDYKEVVSFFEKGGFDSGAITFSSIHPRWSYAKLENNLVIQVAEKRPISKHAIAGFYYFKHGKDFIEAAESSILKDNNLNGVFYISSTLNELILQGKKVGIYEISKESYHSFYSPEKIKEYESSLAK
jgi:NDP-sugar pyrophosphorylase family protein